MKCIWHCQPKSTDSSVLDNDCIRSQNLLLSFTTDAQSPNIDYKCNLYNDQYGDDEYADDQSSVNYDSNISHTDDIVDTDDFNTSDRRSESLSLNIE